MNSSQIKVTLPIIKPSTGAEKSKSFASFDFEFTVFVSFFRDNIFPHLGQVCFLKCVNIGLSYVRFLLNVSLLSKMISSYCSGLTLNINPPPNNDAAFVCALNPSFAKYPYIALPPKAIASPETPSSISWP